MLAALAATLFNVASAAKQCGISRDTHYRWMKGSKYKAAVEELSDYALDYAESKLMKNIGADRAMHKSTGQSLILTH